MPSDCEIAWAAGIFEGEGSFSVVRNPSRKSVGLLIALGMTDHDVIERFHAIVGVGNVTLRKRPDPRHQDQWLWQAAAIDDVRHVIRMFSPWLGERRAARAAEVLFIYDSAPALRINKTHCPQGHEFTPENTLLIYGKWRRCRECNRIGQKKQREKKVSV